MAGDEKFRELFEPHLMGDVLSAKSLDIVDDTVCKLGKELYREPTVPELLERLRTDNREAFKKWQEEEAKKKGG